MKPTVAAPFGEGMVLERNVPVRIWGKADSNAMVTISLQGKTETVISDSNGGWQAVIGPLSASVSETLVVESTGGKSCISGVLVGEVWLAGGQSNMEFQMRYDAGYEAALKTCEDPLIRYYEVPRISDDKQKEKRDYSLFGFWRRACPEDLSYFSAVSYYFALRLRENLQVPVGIIGCNWGGTSASCWMSRDTLAGCGSVWISDYEEGLKNIHVPEKAEEAYYKNPDFDTSRPFDRPFQDRLFYGISREEMYRTFEKMAAEGLIPVIGPWSELRPSGLYEKMLKTITPFTFAGVLWYQGESDVAHSDLYGKMLSGLIREWRSEFKCELPFIMAQLAPFGEQVDDMSRDFPVIRKKQEEVARSMNGVWLASTSDVGHPYDIHPKEKQPVGTRMALLALRHVYAMNVKADAPEAAAVTEAAGKVTIFFNNAEDGLFLKGEKIQALKLLDKNGREVPEEKWSASAEGAVITIDTERCKEEISEIVFAGTPYYDVNLFNMAGLPVKPFTAALTN